MSKVTNECQAASAKSCNAHCDDYECPRNAGGVCRAPNPCLGYEEAAKLLAGLAEVKRQLADLKRAGGDAAAHLEDGLRAIMALTEPSAHALDLLGTVHRTAKECLRQTPPIATAEKSSAVGDAAKLREALVEISKFADDWELYGNTKAGALDRIYELANAALAATEKE